MDHIGYWSSDLNADKRRLVERGAPMEFDSCPYGRSLPITASTAWAYH
jgi:hypothetical protein